MTRSEGEQSRPSRRLGITGYVGLVREGYDELAKAMKTPPRTSPSPGVRAVGDSFTAELTGSLPCAGRELPLDPCQGVNHPAPWAREPALCSL